MGIARWGPVLVAGFLFVLAGSGDEPKAPAVLRPAQAAPPSDFRGSGSCSATACHGSIIPLASSAVRRNEHKSWISEDPHSGAYQTLFDKRSERIACNLAADPAHVKPAYDDDRCLACHTTPRPANVLAATSWMNPDGVGCESCHGASGRWVGRHTMSDWTGKGRQVKEGFGLSDTKTLASRAKVCAGCHVGGGHGDGLPMRDVNHNLIAAGHPRLNFELAAYLDNMPAHWDEKSENFGPVGPTHRAKDFSVRAWAIGQSATELASLQLLHRRADDNTSPWPEFTEYACFSCHHDLRDEAWRRRSRSGGATAGAPRWGSWTMPQTDELIEQLVIDPAVPPYTNSLHQLRAQMAKSFPDRPIVARQARETVGSLSRCLTVLAMKRFKTGEVEGLVKMLDDAKAWDRVASWDEAVRIYLALVALRQAWVELEPARQKDQEKLGTRLNDVRVKLNFPDGFDSPHGINPGLLRP